MNRNQHQQSDQNNKQPQQHKNYQLLIEEATHAANEASNHYQFFYSKNPNKRVNFVSQYQNLPPSPQVRQTSYRPADVQHLIPNQIVASQPVNNAKGGIATSQEYVKKSSSFQQILAGGMSASCYVHTSMPNNNEIGSRVRISEGCRSVLTQRS